MRLSNNLLETVLKDIHKPSTLSDALLDLQDARGALRSLYKEPQFLKLPSPVKRKVRRSLGLKKTAYLFNYKYRVRGYDSEREGFTTNYRHTEVNDVYEGQITVKAFSKEEAELKAKRKYQNMVDGIDASRFGHSRSVGLISLRMTQRGPA